MDGSVAPANEEPGAAPSPRPAASPIRPQLPVEAIRGEPAIATTVPFGLGRPGPWALEAGLRTFWSQRHAIGHLRAILDRGVHLGNALGVRGASVPGARGWSLTAGRLQALADHGDRVLHPTRVSDLRHLRTAAPMERRRIGRVGHPLLLRDGGRGFERIGWDEAEALAIEALGVSPARQAWVVGDVSNEAAHALRATAEAGGVPLDSLAAVRHRGARAALADRLGFAEGSCRLLDLPHTSLLLLWRACLPDHAPEALALVRDARSRGARVVVIDAVRDPAVEAAFLGTPQSALLGTTLVDDTVLVPPGSEELVATALLSFLARWNAVDEATCRRQFVDWPTARAELAAWSPDEPLRALGVSGARIEWLAKLIAAAPTVLSVVGEPLWTGRGGRDALAAIAQLHVATGPLRRPGCGVLPLWSDAADQGCHDLGVEATVPAHRLLDRLADAEAGEVDTVVLAEADLSAVLPDPARTRRALTRVRHRVHHVTHLDATTLCSPAPGGWALVLPATSRFDEIGGTTTTSLDRRLCFNPELPTRRQVGTSRAVHDVLPALADAAWADVHVPVVGCTTAVLRRQMAEKIERYGPAASLGPDVPELPLGPSRHEADPAPRPCRPPPTVAPPADGFALALRPGVPLGGEARLPATGRGLARDEVGISSADAADHDVVDGKPVTLASETGRWVGRARILDQARGTLWVPWPECAVLVPWASDDDGGLQIDVQVSLAAR